MLLLCRPFSPSLLFLNLSSFTARSKDVPRNGTLLSLITSLTTVSYDMIFLLLPSHPPFSFSWFTLLNNSFLSLSNCPLNDLFFHALSFPPFSCLNIFLSLFTLHLSSVTGLSPSSSFPHNDLFSHSLFLSSIAPFIALPSAFSLPMSSISRFLSTKSPARGAARDVTYGNGEGRREGGGLREREGREEKEEDGK